MKGLTAELLGRACRVFLEQAYPGGPATLPPKARRFWDLAPDQPLEPLLNARDVCEKLSTPEGGLRGYAFRLGSVQFPHIKLQAFPQDHDQILFAVDTHDVLRCALSPEEAEKWSTLQKENRKLKERIEQEWERQGFLTFNGLLRQALDPKAG